MSDLTRETLRLMYDARERAIRERGCSVCGRRPERPWTSAAKEFTCIEYMRADTLPLDWDFLCNVCQRWAEWIFHSATNLNRSTRRLRQ